MIQNSPIRTLEFKLKKFIKRSIHHQSLANCDLLMTRPKLHLFYDQLHDHLVQEKLSKEQKQKRRRSSLEVQSAVVRLQERKETKIVTEPEWILSRAHIKSRVSVNKNKRKSLDEGWEPHKELIKEQIESDMNYFVRMVKNPKTIRYIKSKPPSSEVKQVSFEPKPEYCRKPKLMNTNYEERQNIFKKLKNSLNFRHSTMG